MNRSEHLAWAKGRALDYVKAGNLQDAYTSFASDLGKHPELQQHPAIMLGMMEQMSGGLKTAAQMEDFITGAN